MSLVGISQDPGLFISSIGGSDFDSLVISSNPKMVMQRAVFSLASSESTTSRQESDSDPFSAPPSQSSAAVSVAEIYSTALQRPRYYHSRRLRKDENYSPPQFRREPGEKWLWIIPLIGLIAGFMVSGYLVYSAMGGPPLKYCPVLDEDFSSGALNPRIWTKEVEVGGFGFVRTLVRSTWFRD